LPVVKFLSFDKEYGCPIEKKYSAPIIPLKSWSSRLENINETQSLEKRYKAMSQIKQWAIKLRKHEGKEIRRIKHLLNGRFVVNDVDVCQIDNLMLKHWEEFADALLYHCQLYDGTLSSKICRPTQHILPTSIEFYGIPMQQNLCNVLVPTLSHASIDELAFNFCRLDSKDGIQFLSQILETNSNVKKIAIQSPFPIRGQHWIALQTVTVIVIQMVIITSISSRTMNQTVTVIVIQIVIITSITLGTKRSVNFLTAMKRNQTVILKMAMTMKTSAHSAMPLPIIQT
jgi:hypothetical protein